FVWSPIYSHIRAATACCRASLWSMGSAQVLGSNSPSGMGSLAGSLLGDDVWEQPVRCFTLVQLSCWSTLVPDACVVSTLPWGYVLQLHCHPPISGWVGITGDPM
ncbi:hypothetical protein GOODEAATRI_020709, partial [Goodea atripinnis]